MKPFIPFSALHGNISLAGIAMILLVAWYAKKHATPRSYPRDAHLFMLLMAGIYALLTITKILQHEWTIQGNLPLHLCDISAWTLVYALYTKNNRAFQAGYFWGMTGALLAFGSPNVQTIDWYLIPFFTWHALLAAAPIYFMLTQKTYPTHRGLWQTIAMTILLAFVVMGFNHLIGSNYMFVNRKIDAMNPLGFPEYPTYLLYLIPIMIVLFYLFYLPFAFAKKR
jgi:hypothetical integral membrane protein (TIGR02206 family)